MRKPWPLTIKVNGVDKAIDVDGDTPLLWVLRDVLGMTGNRDEVRLRRSARRRWVVERSFAWATRFLAFADLIFNKAVTAMLSP